ncbi:MAG: purB [Acidobacteria bacterium]|nr:purB [Acidobacteriota bacterium]
MRLLWSEHHKRLLWREIWVALAEIQETYGLVSPEQSADLRAHMNDVDIERSLAIEQEIKHDLMAEIQVFAEQAKRGGAILHLGATSMDVEDNADAMRLRQSLDLTLTRLASLLEILAKLVNQYAESPLIAYTHLQPAEPSTLGYRIALYAQDLLEDFKQIKNQRDAIRGKGFKGAVGTGASYAELIGKERLSEFESRLEEKLGITFYPIAAQTYPRKQDYTLLSALAGLGQSLYKMAFDLRIIQSPPFGEMAEPFGSRQVGSSAMPFKRNPIRAEKIDSLGRYLAGLPRIAWDNAAHSLLERTLDDSANRRIILPEAFLAIDEMLKTTSEIYSDLRVDEKAMQRNLKTYGPFAATERVMMAAVKSGADRQQMHELIRGHALRAWEEIQAGKVNPLEDLLSKDGELAKFLKKEQLLELMKYESHLGDAPERARQLIAQIQREIKLKAGT